MVKAALAGPKYLPWGHCCTFQNKQKLACSMVSRRQVSASRFCSDDDVFPLLNGAQRVLKRLYLTDSVFVILGTSWLRRQIMARVDGGTAHTKQFSYMLLLHLNNKYRSRLCRFKLWAPQITMQEWFCLSYQRAKPKRSWHPTAYSEHCGLMVRADFAILRLEYDRCLF